MKRAVVVFGLMAALSACSGGAVDSTESVCDDFAAHARDGLQSSERTQVTRDIGEVIDNADERLVDAHEALVRTAAGTDDAYQIAADTFAQACFDAGWDG